MEKMMNDAYVEGFVKTCQARGVDPQWLLKRADRDAGTAAGTGAKASYRPPPSSEMRAANTRQMPNIVNPTVSKSVASIGAATNTVNAAQPTK